MALYGLAGIIAGFVWALQRRLLLWRRRGWDIVGDKIWEHMGRYR